ncbi:UDP-3-O-[3-hydroxymyristoyl] glucosamine N-acyltransferase [Panacagrimonas perspica]|uniref:UDP-3-O-acylglucosamine N-acyltransferase n=1 Tax=Panacagrimonas perspica TaxID=381431 RepID=A0A4S3K3F3_9GAMM|nr:UDP-3-O-(3-hydroxymyristoyl)glucosamine N-acyltransferase [Panacagrimonas perspica]TDU31220.1 UDP-3-O-[3-hydroxymyristoyl] glucosamine N-acyltransferase [Panacagrimonas perspica]THD02575.1 UDP-3-O-(3-hydroxymyristoyl)glucosamine N-acyltransferase [Panacagrimonas perspica]
MAGHTLGGLASRFGLESRGDVATPIDGVCNLSPGKPGCLSFLSSPQYRKFLTETAAAAVIVRPRDAAALTGAGLIAKDPYLAYARIAALFDPDRNFEPGIHPSAVIDPAAKIGEGVLIGANVVVMARASIGAGSSIGAGCVIGEDTVIGEGARFVAQVHVGNRVCIGRRCHVQPGAVIGSRGFGNALGPSGWEEVPQLGSVVIGDDVEIGANTCIDRGALDDTLIANGVRLDNLIQIAHNCSIGEHTAIAACTGIAGSTRIGARCMIGGAVGISGHLEITDDVVILGRTMVTRSLTEKGAYGSDLPVAPAREWRKRTVRVRRLDQTERRLTSIEKTLGIESKKGNEGDDGGDD